MIAFDRPGYLLLLAILPCLWWWSRHSLAGLGKVRRWIALVLRSAVLTAVIFALAEAQWVRQCDRLTVFYLLDESLSIPPEEDEAMLRYVKAAIRAQRSAHPDDRAGVIAFGREAAIEIPPLEEEPDLPKIESLIERDNTNIAAAMKLAEASFPHDSAKRIVILSDGNENLGDALAQARPLAEAGVSIDVVPIRPPQRAEVAVEKISIPPDVRRGQPFDLRVVLNSSPPADQPDRTVRGRLLVLRKAGERETILAEEPVDLSPGKRVFTIREEIEAPDFYDYEARFVPDRPADDSRPQNNQASTFTHVRGSGQVLLIEDHENKGEYDLLVERLKAQNLEVVVRTSSPEDLFTDLGQLQPFDTVMLADVPREHFSDNQVDVLVRNTQNLGSGLIMLGGPNSFGAGGWTGTKLEAAMPVDFQINNAKVVPSGALVIVLDRSGSMMGEKIEMSKAAAIAAVKTLGSRDQIGVIAFDSFASWIVPLTIVGDGQKAAARISRLGADGGTNMMPAMSEGAKALGKAQAAIKHMIVLTDGHTEGTGYPQLAAQMRRKGMTTTAVAVGSDADVGLMQRIAQEGGGKFYSVSNAKMIPRIFMKEARRVSRPLVFERTEGIRPQVRFPHEMIQGIEDPLPPITGFVLTTVKEGPLPEVSLVSPLPADGANNTILASWTYGLGKAVALTTDAGQRWAQAWTAWQNYDKLFSQIVRWSMRPVGDLGKFSLSSDVTDGRARLVVTALDKDDEFLNLLEMGGTVVGPDMKPIELNARQVAPGRYVAEFDTPTKGNYFVLLSPGPGRTPLRVGVNVPYSNEFRGRQSNEVLLKSLAALRPRGGQPGRVIEDPNPNDTPTQRLSKLLEVNTFRHDLPPAKSTQDVWHLLLLAAACLFVGDVFVRRVAINFDWLPPAWGRMRDQLLRRRTPAAPNVVMDRLRSRKAEVGEQLVQRRETARFEPENSALPPALEPDPPPRAAEKRPQPIGAPLAPEAEAESYTSRLLKAKQKVRDERKQDPPT